MEYRIIYCDVLFLINFSMDFLILYITASLRMLPKHAVRLPLASLIGAGYEIVTVILPGNQLIYLLLSVLMSVVMCAIAFDFRQQMAGKVKTVIVFYFVNMLFGGAAGGIMYLTGKTLPGIMQHEGRQMNAWHLILFAILITILLLLILRTRHIRTKAPIAVCVCFQRNNVSLQCLVDSGNLVTEPFSGYPVIMCNREVFEKYKTLPNKRVIPVQTVTGKMLLDGFLPDKIICNQNGKEYIRKAAIGFSNETIRNANQDIDGLVPSLMLDA